MTVIIASLYVICLCCTCLKLNFTNTLTRFLPYTVHLRLILRSTILCRIQQHLLNLLQHQVQLHHRLNCLFFLRYQSNLDPQLLFQITSNLNVPIPQKGSFTIKETLPNRHQFIQPISKSAKWKALLLIPKAKRRYGSSWI